MKARCHGGNQRCLLANRFGVKIRIHSTQNFWQERKKVELHRQTVPARGHQIGFQRTQCAFVGLAILVGKFIPARPPSGTDHVQPGVVNLTQIAVPDVNVGMIEIQALNFAGHVGGANDGEGLAIELKVVLVHAELRAGAEVVFIADPESGVVGSADFAID